MNKWEKIRNTHPNSVEAYHSGLLKGSFSDREEQIMIALEVLGSGTDREISEEIGHYHKSAVQPRITELVNDARILEEMSVRKYDTMTEEFVRVVRIRPLNDSRQIELFA